jgi:hypothetical protein
MVAGEFICGVTLDNVDRLTDFDREHDPSRVICRELLVRPLLFTRGTAPGGLCYLATHHYLDKLASVIRGRYVKLFVKKRLSSESLIEKVKSELEDEVSVLALLAYHLVDLKRPNLRALLQ